MPRLAGFPRYRPAALWRYIDEFRCCAGGGARIEVEAKTKLCQELKFKPGHQRGSEPRIAQMRNRVLKQIEHRLVRIALRQQPAQRRKMIEAIKGVRHRQVRCCTQIEPLDDIIAEMFVEPRPPPGAHQVPGLQHGLEARARAAAHETQMTPMFPRHQLDNGTRLAMASGAEHDADIGPLHESCPRNNS